MKISTIAEIQKQFTDKSLSPVELCQHYLNQIEQHNNQLNSFITVNHEVALTQAKQAEQAIAAGNGRPLSGIPIAHKDIFCTKDLKTSCGSKMLDSFVSPYDATVVEKLANQGIVCLGKTNMDEFAMGSSNVTSYYGKALNPWNIDTVPGGSSGGSAAAVAAGLCVAATGTDTGGSIRQPAAFCGLTGIKPTYGTISRYGMVAFASSLDQAGPMTRHAEDAALMLEHMMGQDPKDSTSVKHPNPHFSQQLGKSIEGLKIGIPKQYFSEELDATIAEKVELAAKLLESMGAQLVELSLQYTELAVPCYYIIAPAEASSNLSRYDGVRFGHRSVEAKNLDQLYKFSRSEGFGDEVKRRILVGTYALSSGYYDAYYIKAQKVRRLIRDEFLNAFKSVDVIISPTAPSTAFKFSEIKQNDPIQMYLSDLYTIAANLAGLPALSMPCGFVNDLPVGIQLIGNHFAEGKLLNIAHQYQLNSNHHLQSPSNITGVLS